MNEDDFFCDANKDKIEDCISEIDDGG